MKALIKVASVLVVLSFFTPFFAATGIGPGGKIPFVSQSLAFAAEDSNDEEATAPKSEAVWDPLEGFNRGVFKFNDKVYFWVMKPTATVYKAYFPEGFRTCLRNAFTNFMFPIRFVNNVFQLKFDHAGTEVARFAVNTTLGFAGFWDIAARDFNLKAYNEDFGQTLGHYGVKPGFYLVLPVLGPSNARDSVGLAGDSFTMPLGYFVDLYVSASIKAGSALNSASLRLGEYEDFKKSALDPYVSMREAYQQYRAEQVLEK